MTDVEVETAYRKRVDRFKETHPDWDAVIASRTDIELPRSLLHSFRQLERGPEIAYILAKHMARA